MEQREIDNMLLSMIQKHFPSLPLSDEYTDWGKWLGFTRAVYEAGRASHASVPEDRTQAGVRPAPVLIGDVVEADCAELRDIAAWFESRGKPMQGEFLRRVADRYEVIFGVYWTATVRGSSVVA